MMVEMTHNQKFLLLAMVALTAIILSCSCNSTDSDDTPTFVLFDDYAYFDTDEYTLMRSSVNDSALEGELYLWWEHNYGEPFTDVNGNGIYEPEIDIFISCACDSNQDYNVNFKWDSANSIWLGGEPFDDIDNNGTCRQEPGANQGAWVPGVPFCDYNGNGVFDSLPEFDHQMVQLVLTDSGTSYREYHYFPRDSAWQFVSDSQITYVIPPGDPFGPENHDTIPLLDFEVDDSGLTYIDRAHDIWFFHVLETGSNQTGKVYDSVLWFSGGIQRPRFNKTVSFGVSLAVGNGTLHNLVRVRYDKPIYLHDEFEELYSYTWREFYFSKSAGLVAVIMFPERGGDIYRYYFDTRYDNLPVEMTR